MRVSLELTAILGLKAFFPHPSHPPQPTDNYNTHLPNTQARPFVTRAGLGGPSFLALSTTVRIARRWSQMVRTSSKGLHLRALVQLTLLVSATAFMLAPPRLSSVSSDARLFQLSNAGVRRGECLRRERKQHEKGRDRPTCDAKRQARAGDRVSPTAPIHMSMTNVNFMLRFL